MPRILAVADEPSPLAATEAFREMAPDVVVACGDLPADYLGSLAAVTAKRVLYVLGNHDAETAAPGDCIHLDGQVVEVAGLRLAGLGGSHRYRPGPNQYSQSEMEKRCRGLLRRAARKGRVDGRLFDVLVTHAPPQGVGDDDDNCHTGFAAFHPLVRRAAPRLLVHGHIHRYGRAVPDATIGETMVVNAVGYRLLEV